jgi:carbon storage regulator CsrA
MLVLTRRAAQQIAFPNLGITLSVIRIQGNAVRLGIEAPPQVRVLRGEISRASPTPIEPGKLVDEHHLRNCLNTAVLALSVASKQAKSNPEESASMIGHAMRELDEINQALRRGQKGAPQDPVPRDVRIDRRSASWRALLVEDNDNERQLLAGYLRISGFEVAEANDGRSAICYLKHHDVPDVMLLDMNMPRFDGVKAVNWIRESDRLRTMRIFGVSVTRPDRSPFGPGDRGVDHWIEKPINPEDVVKRMSRAIVMS